MKTAGPNQLPPVPPAAAVPPPGRPDLGSVLTRYQVVADPGGQQTFSPFWPTSFEERTGSATEVRLLENLWPHQLAELKGVVGGAEDTSRELYPDPAGGLPPGRDQKWLEVDGHRDAFRHAYGSALMEKEFGSAYAEQLGTAHEATPDGLIPPAEEAMDLYNNEVGRRIAREHPQASEEELATLVQQAVGRGDTVVVDANGNLGWSDQVPLWQHGRAGGGVLPGQIPVPDGEATPS